jgi:hypothetical protein
MKPYIYSIVFGTTLACAIGCATNSADKSAAAKPSDGKVRPQAVAVLSPAPNGKVKGQVTFQEATEGVRVIANIEGLTPASMDSTFMRKAIVRRPILLPPVAISIPQK